MALLVVALLASILAVGLHRPSTAFDVTWSTRSDSFEEGPATRSGAGELDPIDVEIPRMNITRVDFTVTVEGSGPRLQDRSFEVRVEPPDNLSAESGSGTLPTGAGAAQATVNLPFPVSDVPADGTVEAPTEAAAQEEMTAEHAHDVGSGTWRVIVTIQGTASDAILPPEVFTVTVTAAVETFEATVTVRIPDVQAA